MHISFSVANIQYFSETAKKNCEFLYDKCLNIQEMIQLLAVCVMFQNVNSDQ